MVDICPAILAPDQAEYEAQIKRVTSFATRLHIDIADGAFASQKTIGAADIWWPGGVRADIHVMYKRPAEIIDTLIALGPQLVVMHAEAEGDFMTLSKKLHYHGIEAGVALLPSTPVDLIKSSIDSIDHVLIFSGNLGHYGGAANLSLLEKAREIRAVSYRVEIGWDGGATDQNVAALAQGGIEVITSGGFIQKSANPAEAFNALVQSANPKGGS